MMSPAIFAGWVLVFASATTSYVTQSVIGGARLIYMPQFVYREVGILFQWPMAAAISFLLLLSTGIVMLALTMLARHRRLARLWLTCATTLSSDQLYWIFVIGSRRLLA